MSKFKNKAEFEVWAQEQFTKYGIRQPHTYSEQELIDLNPGVPVDFIKKHVIKRDKVAQ
jgi:hypothetical protein|tara:strand:- start:315 stop:491 length:177 start_codon:yes stop_codon:yes gene_type:complete